MELIITFSALPAGKSLDDMMGDMDRILEDSGLMVNAQMTEQGGLMELSLEEEQHNPKYAIMAVRSYLQQAGFPRDTAIELAGMASCIY